jgi:hypothetical protein
MVDRRSFFKSALGALVAPLLPISTTPTKTVTKAFKDWQGIVYAPYIPLLTMTEHVSLEIQKEIDEDMSSRILQVTMDDTLYAKQTITTNGELV